MCLFVHMYTAEVVTKLEGMKHKQSHTFFVNSES